MARLDDPPVLDPLRIVPTQYTANGDEINSTVGQRVEDKVGVQREIGVTIPSGIRDLVRKLRDTNDQHNRIETTEIPDWWKKQKDKLEKYLAEIQESVNTLYGLIGSPNFYPIIGVSYFGGFAAPKSVVDEDLEWFAKHRWKSVRVGCVWRAESGYGCINPDGTLNSANMANAKYLIGLANSMNMSVDLTVFGTHINSLSALENGLRDMCRELAEFKFCFVDVLNEHQGPTGQASPSEIKALLDAAGEGDGGRAVTASTSGSVESQIATYLADYAAGCRYTFHTPHFERSADWDTALSERLHDFAEGVGKTTHGLRMHAQEESRYGKPSTTVTQKQNFFYSLENARQGGAIGWNFHSEAGYDLRSASFKSQCNAVENDVIKEGLDNWVDP